MILTAALALMALSPGDAAPADFRLSTLVGRTVSFAELKGKITVVAFISAKCPISNAYQDRMTALVRSHEARGVRFVFINSNENEPVREILQHSKDAGLVFPVYKDFNNRVADLFGAQMTPETFVVGPDGIVRYHGALDDSTNAARVKVHGLQSALDALLAGKVPALAETKAFGCVIKKVHSSL